MYAESPVQLQDSYTRNSYKELNCTLIFGSSDEQSDRGFFPDEEQYGVFTLFIISSLLSEWFSRAPDPIRDFPVYLNVLCEHSSVDSCHLRIHQKHV
ncbi:hypothetical protein MLD38_030134 [Melastoma candidum]|uniref:Uncharacterized protein n=1 Tax=Melastoma candidum TaxID=119954 RepID=A0ACB9MKR9_9MYRT|nr:hypothetical protein MLD38_030134 [Melastoma candidum]